MVIAIQSISNLLWLMPKAHFQSAYMCNKQINKYCSPKRDRRHRLNNSSHTTQVWKGQRAEPVQAHSAVA